MIAVKKRHWLWNLVIGFTVLVCLGAFVLHYKNWIKEEEGGVVLFSGFYVSEIRYGALESLQMVPRIPEMERKSGFSVWGVEKGIFRDTLSGVEGIRVYVDELKYPKILIEQKEYPPIYLNFKDSLRTAVFFERLKGKMDESSED
ncbi:hypothetical protein [Muriicola marianensis]|uniref:Uncharacterized protein n=1 Tax=Muriicola marianensis TaxID=1324801 RepID=A0ABQ1QYC7_9FLAO|nr:hypothetical protein [Muriicola marianensis]GGD48327.1 hypothetical protein GCM10011361_13900 [Muriicola marianensis]